MSEIKLNPCPFCGGTGEIINAIQSVFWVKCNDCGATSENASTEHEAIENWNRRTPNE